MSIEETNVIICTVMLLGCRWHWSTDCVERCQSENNLSRIRENYFCRQLNEWKIVVQEFIKKFFFPSLSYFSPKKLKWNWWTEWAMRRSVNRIIFPFPSLEIVESRNGGTHLMYFLFGFVVVFFVLFQVLRAKCFLTVLLGFSPVAN